MDAQARLESAFRDELERHSGLLTELESDQVLADELGREAAWSVLGALTWRAMLGADRLNTTQVSQMLGVTRQAIHKRALAHRILAVPGRGTSWFPAWQFDLERHVVRESAVDLLRSWADVLGDAYDPRTLLSWANTVQDELGGIAPRDWILDSQDGQRLVLAARQAAGSLAA